MVAQPFPNNPSSTTESLANLQVRIAELEEQVRQYELTLQQERAAKQQYETRLKRTQELPTSPEILYQGEHEFCTLVENIPDIIFRQLFEDAPIGVGLMHPETCRCLQANAMLAEMLGYSEAELTQMDFIQLTHPDDIHSDLEQLQQMIAGTTSRFQMEKRFIKKNGAVMWGNLTATLIRHQDGTPLYSMGMVEDISEAKHDEVVRKQVEQQIKASLQEKEVLLKEVHHRVKNNLQVISSLLRMQARQTNDGSTAALFQDAQHRVQSMSLIHEQLYQSPNLSQIDFGDYLYRLVNNLFHSYGISQQQIALEIETNEPNLTLNTAIPCGLIVNELVSNSLKYAFPNGQSGTIAIQLQSQPCHEHIGSYQGILTISDNGIGIPQNLDWQTSPSLGLRIVRNLVTQLKGTLTLSQSRGTHFCITFPRT